MSTSLFFNNCLAIIVPAEPAPMINVLFLLVDFIINESLNILQQKRDPPINNKCNDQVTASRRKKISPIKICWTIAAIKMERVTTLKMMNNSPILAYSHAFLYNLYRNEKK